MIFSLISFIFSLCGFCYGAFHLFRSKKPLYFKLIIAASGCMTFANLSAMVNSLTGGSYYVTLGYLGILGSLLFLLSADYGSLDQIVDDGVGTKKYRLFSLVAPIVMILALACIFIKAYSLGIAIGVLIICILFPAVPASYFTLKHLILPIDAVGFLNGTRKLNLCALLYYVSLYVLVFAMLSDSHLGSALSIANSLILSLVSIFAVKGEKIWKQSI